MATMVIADMTHEELERTFGEASASLLVLPHSRPERRRRRPAPRRRSSARSRPAAQAR